MSEVINNNGLSAGIVGFENVVVTSDKKFKPREEFNNLCLGHLVSVEIKETVTPKIDDKGVASTYEYAGISVPTLVFKYKEEPVPGDDADRFYSDSFRIVTTRKSDGTAIDIKTFSSILMDTYRHCRHRLDAYAGCPNFKEPGFPAPIDMNASIDERLKQWKAFCEFFVNAFNKGKDDKAVYKNEKNEDIIVWIKLVAKYPENKYLAVPTFVGEGYIEKYVEGRCPSIEIKPNETIKLSEKTDEKKSSPAAEAGATLGYGDGASSMTADAVAALQSKYAGGNTFTKY